MKIDGITVQIGGVEHTLYGVESQDPVFLKLLHISTEVQGVIKLKLPQNDETAVLLGQLAFGREGVTLASLHLLEVLSMPTEQLNLWTEIINQLKRNGLQYVWQVASSSRDELLKLRGIGQCRVWYIDKALTGLGLHLEMNLSEIQDKLPT